MAESTASATGSSKTSQDQALSTAYTITEWWRRCNNTTHFDDSQPTRKPSHISPRQPMSGSAWAGPVGEHQACPIVSGALVGAYTSGAESTGDWPRHHTFSGGRGASKPCSRPWQTSQRPRHRVKRASSVGIYGRARLPSPWRKPSFRCLSRPHP